MQLGMGRVGGTVTFLARKGDGPWVDAGRLAACLEDVLQDWERFEAMLHNQLPALPALKNNSSVRWLPPVQRPSKILAVGRNYAEHAAEQGASVPEEPIIFSKLPSALVGDGDAIQLPAESQEVDFEAELVAVIGKPGRRIPAADALSHVAGYTCGNDITARDWQKGKPGGQWLLGKSFDTFAPVGPWIVTRDEVPDPQDLQIQLTLNGSVMQTGSTADQLFPVADLIAYISNVATLEPGDLVFTGTPPGVGMARKPPVFLKAGDLLEVRIPQIGTLRSRVTQLA